MARFNVEIANWLLDPDRHHKPVENAEVLKKRLKKEGLLKVYEEIELPLVEILKDIKEIGITVNTSVLKTLSQKLNKEIENLVKKIYKEAGEVFNINSPKQLLLILNKKLGFRLSSTNVEKLTEAQNKHPLIPLILQYRELTKIKSTYVEPLISAAQKDSKVHTTLLQTGAATGRFSSRNPNLQNLPKDSDLANEVRRAFVASKGYKLVSLDYSQIQLRILATVSADNGLMMAFRKENDIHRLTAEKIFSVGPREVTPEMRRVAKTINFGIIYGMGPQALSRESGFDYERAQNFIDEYFLNFPGVRKWQERVKDEVTRHGYVVNLNGRRRYFEPPVNLRAAVNTPIQSLEADIVKLAIIKIHKELNKNRTWQKETRLLLTVHDELLFEIRDDKIKKSARVIKEMMESAYKLTVPIKVDVKIGENWADMKPFNV